MNKNIKDKIIETASRHNTPFFIYDLFGITEKYRQLSKVFKEYFEIFFSAKANPNPEVLKLLNSLGAGVEVASGGELQKALDAGFDKDRIVFTGPGKVQHDLKLALNKDILAINVESLGEIYRISSLLSANMDDKYAKCANISIRVNPTASCEGAKLQMSGTATQFGIDVSELDTAIEFVLKEPNLNLKGFHVYFGSQILSEAAILNNFRYIFKLTAYIKDKFKFPISFIDFGGGFGEPYFSGEKELNIDFLEQSIADLIHEYNDLICEGTKLIVESGRFLTLRNGYYICRVLRTGIKNNTAYAVLDGGVHHNSPAACFGGWLRKNYPIYAITQKIQTYKLEYSLWGPNNTISDLLGKGVTLPVLEPGDLVIFENAGAYTYTVSPNLFCNRPPAQEFLL